MSITHPNVGHLSLLAPFDDEKVRLHHNSFWQDQLQVALLHMPRTSFPWLDETPVPPAFFVRLHGVFGPYSAHALRHGHDPDHLRNAERHPSEWVVRRGQTPWPRLFDERARVV